jgi:hypothetical protein
MREAVATIEEAGLTADMTRSTIEWQQRVGDLRLSLDTDDLVIVSRSINEKLNGDR